VSSSAGYLIDSHVLLWWWFDPDRLSSTVLERLIDPANSILVSAASVWELSLKYHRGKLPELGDAIADLQGLLQADGFIGLPITAAISSDSSPPNNRFYRSTRLTRSST
jgi:PIN domain nuclease of toxin-antitoxin system